MLPGPNESKDKQNIRIEDAGKHSAETLAKLQMILARGSRMAPDPKRKHFYEVPAEPCVDYIHVSPVSGKISLLAVWGNRPGVDCAGRTA